MVGASYIFLSAGEGQSEGARETKSSHGLDTVYFPNLNCKKTPLDDNMMYYTVVRMFENKTALYYSKN